jgi:hypothetical protein
MSMKNVTRRFAFGILCLCLAGAHPLAAEAASPLDAYGRLPALEDWALSPDGTKAAYVQTKDNDRYILIRTLPDVQLIGGSRIGNESYVPSDGWTTPTC